MDEQMAKKNRMIVKRPVANRALQGIKKYGDAFPLYWSIFKEMEPPKMMTPSELDKKWKYPPGTVHDLVVRYWKADQEIALERKRKHAETKKEAANVGSEGNSEEPVD